MNTSCSSKSLLSVPVQAVWTNMSSRGFAAKTSSKALSTVQALGENWNAQIEEDKTVSISRINH